jgi:hypothetical protein
MKKVAGVLCIALLTACSGLTIEKSATSTDSTKVVTPVVVKDTVVLKKDTVVLKKDSLKK